MDLKTHDLDTETGKGAINLCETLEVIFKERTITIGIRECLDLSIGTLPVPEAEFYMLPGPINFDYCNTVDPEDAHQSASSVNLGCQ